MSPHDPARVDDGRSRGMTSVAAAGAVDCEDSGGGIRENVPLPDVGLEGSDRGCPAEGRGGVGHAAALWVGCSHVSVGTLPFVARSIL